MVLIDIIYDAASSTFIQVGTFVGITLLFFGYIDYVTKGGFLNGFRKYKKLQVLFGVLLGLTPGCGGAIMVMPLYLKGHATFGTMVATLIATMGDAAFVLLVKDPVSLGWVLLISSITGLAVGYTLDYFHAGQKFAPTAYTEEDLSHNWQFQPEQSEFPDESIVFHKTSSCHMQNTTAATLEDEQIIHIPNIKKAIYQFRHGFAPLIFWTILVLAFPLGILNLMQVDFDNVFPIKNLGILGVVGTFFSVAYNIICKKFIGDDNLPETQSKHNSLKETFVHNAEETAFVIMWVFIALFCYELGLYLIGGEAVMAEFMQKTGYFAVLMALFIGLIPGCGPHIVLATMFVNGLLPFSALITNAICNDGDALFPLIAMDRKSSIWATIFGIIPAWIIGTIFYLLEQANILNLSNMLSL